MKRSSQPDDEEVNRDEIVIHAQPIIVDQPPKVDPKLLDTVLKVDSQSIRYSLQDELFLLLRFSLSTGCWNKFETSRCVNTATSKYSLSILAQ
jgi:hypothetical protein